MSKLMYLWCPEKRSVAIKTQIFSKHATLGQSTQDYKLYKIEMFQKSGEKEVCANNPRPNKALSLLPTHLKPIKNSFFTLCSLLSLLESDQQVPNFQHKNVSHTTRAGLTLADNSLQLVTL